MMISLSASAMASTGSWVTTSWTPSAARSSPAISLRSGARPATSTAASGSSRSSRRGRVIKARANATRWACPPDSSHADRTAASPTPDPIEPSPRLAPRIAPPHSPGPQPEGHVVQRRQVREQEVVLEHHADSPALGRDAHRPRWCFEDVAVEQDLSLLQCHEPGKGRQQRRLACAVGTEHGDGLAVVNVEVHIQGQRPPVQADLGSEGHVRPGRSQRPRRRTRTVIERARRTRLSRIAAPGRCWSSR